MSSKPEKRLHERAKRKKVSSGDAAVKAMKAIISREDAKEAKVSVPSVPDRWGPPCR